ncbi:MAG: diguanylate cyclase [Ferrovum sp.]|nr:diguanylate cyclase [Ferrovum sp.]
MTEKNPGNQRILVIGAGRGGTAMLDLFIADPLVRIVGIIDVNSQAPAMILAQKHGIPNFNNLAEAIEASRPCIAFNLTGDNSVTTYTETQLGSSNVIGGFQARFIWNVLTRLKKTNEVIRYLAQHDTLTTLPNRSLFYDRLNQAMARARRDKGAVAVIFLDLDGFKLVNDTFGHDAGDALLRETSRRISESVREMDTVARMGGDEFTVILSDMRTRPDIERVAKKIVDAISAPFNLDGKICSVSASIGIAIYDGKKETAEQLVKIADEAMYAAKNSGKNGYRFGGD